MADQRHPDLFERSSRRHQQRRKPSDLRWPPGGYCYDVRRLARRASRQQIRSADRSLLPARRFLWAAAEQCDRKLHSLQSQSAPVPELQREPLGGALLPDSRKDETGVPGRRFQRVQSSSLRYRRERTAGKYVRKADLQQRPIEHAAAVTDGA